MEGNRLNDHRLLPAGRDRAPPLLHLDPARVQEDVLEPVEEVGFALLAEELLQDLDLRKSFNP